jgi:predicted dehydrogenase
MWRLVRSGGATPSIEGGEVPVVNQEPLERELADFVDAVSSGRAPEVSGAEGRRALALAAEITDRMTTGPHAPAHEAPPRGHAQTNPNR